MKKFVCLKFSNGSTDIVPRRWMVGYSQCKWPPDSNADIKALAKIEVEPEEHWKEHSCVILCESNSYQKCEEKSYTTAILSETSADEDFTPPPLVRTDSRSIYKQAAAENDNCIRKHKRKSPQKVFLQSKHKKYQSDDLVYEIRSGYAFIGKQLHVLNEKLDRLWYWNVTMSSISSTSTKLWKMEPACTEEELEENLKQSLNPKLLAQQVEVKCLRATFRNFLKVFMAKNLAMQFSWSGMGRSRQQVKRAFKKPPTLHNFSRCSTQHLLPSRCQQRGNSQRNKTSVQQSG
uniref:Uncharacterized protein LOC108949781 n=1 Tax=Phallusia mammillata TaxID=59560 RepID=A0A6F9DK34_9ASCI|nr:uncharacterized protein LOC108949781 [Phallusia mammillata]